MTKTKTTTRKTTTRKAAQAVDLDAARYRVHDIEEQLVGTFIKRRDAVRVMTLALLTGTNFILVGDPGTAKTAVINSYLQHITSAETFGTLMGSFTTPEHVFGVYDIAAFKSGQYKYVTKDMLPEADVAVLDEAMKAGDGCLNALLTALNEKTFQGKSIPLMTCGAATNWPEIDAMTSNVEALFDRFLLRVNVERLTDVDDRIAMFRASEKCEAYVPQASVSTDELKAARAAVINVTISDDMLRMYFETERRLDKDGIGNSDRRWNQLGQLVLKASAWLAGRDEVSVEDFDALRFGMWTRRNDIETLASVLETVDNKVVRETIALIDSARKAFRHCESAGFGAANVELADKEMRQFGRQIRDVLAKPMFTAKGRQDVLNARAELKTDYNQLRKHIKPSNVNG